MTAHPPSDPVLQRRAQAARLAALGQRIGYFLFAAAFAVLVYGLATGFGSGTARVVVVCLIAGSVVLAPAILASYAVKAAVRDDIEHGRAPENP